MATKTKHNLNLARIGEQIDLLLTEIYGEYVAQGSPTKLGGLRFLDVPSAKTFAFEKTQALDDSNLLVLSAPAVSNQKVIEGQMKEGPHANALHEVVLRTSADAGKGNKFFLEIAYKLATPKWVTEARVSKVAEQEACNGNEAVTLILKEEVLPVAREVMAYFIGIVREHSKDDAIL